jgi:hypothetical protein
MLMHDEHVDRDRDDAEAVAVRRDLHHRLWAVLNDPQANFARFPYDVAETLAGCLGTVLETMGTSQPDDVAFGLRLLHQVERQFIATMTPDVVVTTH